MLPSSARSTLRALALPVTVALVASGFSAGQAIADTVRTAKPAEIVAMYSVLRKPRLSPDKPPAGVRAKLTGAKPGIKDWRRLSAARPIEQGGIKGAWLGPTKNGGGLCYGYRTTEGVDAGGCTTVNVRTPREPQPPLSIVFGSETIDDATSIVGTRVRERILVILPDGSSQVKVSERGSTDTRPLTLARNFASTQAVGPWCITYKLEGDTRKLGRDCPAA